MSGEQPAAKRRRVDDAAAAPPPPRARTLRRMAERTAAAASVAAAVLNCAAEPSAPGAGTAAAPAQKVPCGMRPRSLPARPTPRAAPPPAAPTPPAAAAPPPPAAPTPLAAAAPPAPAPREGDSAAAAQPASDTAAAHFVASLTCAHDAGAVSALLQSLTRVAAKWVHKAHPELYGSRVTGLGLGCGEKRDDVDVSVSWPGYDPSRNDEGSRKWMAKKVSALALKLEHAGIVKSLRTLPSRRGTVLCGAIASGELEGVGIDITLNNAHGVTNSKLLRDIAAAYDFLAPTVWMLKKIGKNRGWLCAKAQYLSSYALSLTVAAAAVADGKMAAVVRSGDGGCAALPQNAHSTSAALTAISSSSSEACKGLRLLTSTALQRNVISVALRWATLIMELKPAAGFDITAAGGLREYSADEVRVRVLDPVDGSDASVNCSEPHWQHIVTEAARVRMLVSGGCTLEECCGHDDLDTRHTPHRRTKEHSAEKQPEKGGDAAAAERQCQIEVPVPAADRGKLIGVGAVTHRQIQSLFNVRLAVPRKYADASTPVVVRGSTEESCAAAAAHIRKILKMDSAE
eukprot:TRINITY_DN2652_c6_g1_i1.p1 TRINITY_DN2652_c6_g1~~TRINITY_DN2652_c6_g1_i1.p1  ORF type:complete len:572 (+),score=97.97 TRINITY_DN2652_c6_g1_i1:59-1774(+)